MPSTLIVLPRASRFDRANGRPLAGPAGDLVDEVLGAGTYDTCWAAEFAARRPEYSHIILTGQESLDAFQRGLTLSSQRGFVWHLGAQKIVATFWPQDCVDLQDYETGDDEADQAPGNSKDDAPTSRKNYRFWFMRDCAKLFNTPGPVPEFTYTLLDNTQAAQELSCLTGSTIYFDIESHPDSNTLTCFSWAANDGPVRTVLVYDYKGQLTPGATQLMRALAQALSRNKFVIHNSSFDLLFLALFCGVPAGPDVEDTMLMGHRIFPEAEKSLAHAISLWVNAPYHKSEGGTWNPRSWAQQDQLLRYNAKDVATLRAVHQAQWDYARTLGDQGLIDSLLQVNASIFPYLYASFHGMPFNVMKMLAYRRRHSAAADQLQRLITAMAGSALNPNSPAQMGRYFIDGHGYDVLDRTDTGAPKVDESILYRYLIRYKNPIIRAILKWKRADKVAGVLGFKYFTGMKGR